MSKKTIKDLMVWQKSILLVEEIYILTKNLPKEELYILSSQMRRAAISIPSNIAEGKRRRTRKDFKKFLVIAIGSSEELKTQIIISSKLYPQISYLKAANLIIEIQKMLTSMIRKLESK